jgi:hypothetical protein
MWTSMVREAELPKQWIGMQGCDTQGRALDRIEQ